MTGPPPPPRKRKKSAFEWSLAALEPRELFSTRPSFHFKAGQAAAAKRLRFWQLFAVILGAICFGLIGVAALVIARERDRANRAEEKLTERQPTSSRWESVYRPSEDRSEELPPAFLALTGGLGAVNPTADYSPTPPVILGHPQVQPKAAFSPR